MLARVEEYLRTEGTYDADDWIDEFRAAFGKGGEIKVLEEEWSIGLVTFVSACFPGVPFRARGRGEERDDAWQFECCDGTLTREIPYLGERAGVVADPGPLSVWPAPPRALLGCEPGRIAFVHRGATETRTQLVVTSAAAPWCSTSPDQEQRGRHRAGSCTMS